MSDTGGLLFDLPGQTLLSSQGQPDGEQINYFIQTQRYSGRVFRYNTVRGMKREEVLADNGYEKRDGVFS